MLEITIIIILLLAVFFLSYKLYQFSITIINVENAIEECLDVLNDRQEGVGKILEKDVFFDSVEIRQAIAEIKASQDAIIVVANVLTESVDPKQIEETSGT